MIDWNSIDWWDLPGPSRFIARTTDAIASASGGVFVVLLPSPKPAGLIDRLRDSVLARSGSTVLDVSFRGGLNGRSPASHLAAAAGVRSMGIRTPSDFLKHPELSSTLFIVDEIDASDWRQWTLFLDMFQNERRRIDSVLSPQIVVVPPVDVPTPELDGVIRNSVRWSGQVTRVDTQIYVEKLSGWLGDSLIERTAVSVATELSGWCPDVARLLARLPVETLVDPEAFLVSQMPDVEPSQYPHWGNGMVDYWSGEVWINTAALKASAYDGALRHRIWQGQVRAIFPFLGIVRAAFIHNYHDRLAAALPITKNFHTRPKTISEPRDLENYDLIKILEESVPHEEITFLRRCHKLRNEMAHCDPATPSIIEDVSNRWERISERMLSACPGWEWPRSRQKLVMTVGPSCGGKTTWAEENFAAEEIVSSDRIREEMYGQIVVEGDQSAVFARLRKAAVYRLSRGQMVVIDATNLKKSDRLQNARLAPVDIPVEYVVINRDMAAKKATAGWRGSREGLIDMHEGMFNREIESILASDHLPNVTVNDLRGTSKS